MPQLPDLRLRRPTATVHLVPRDEKGSPIVGHQLSQAAVVRPY